MAKMEPSEDFEPASKNFLARWPKVELQKDFETACSHGKNVAIRVLPGREQQPIKEVQVSLEKGAKKNTKEWTGKVKGYATLDCGR
jgi:hypothetical protein